jgi:subtilisin family serine protease
MSLAAPSRALGWMLAVGLALALALATPAAAGGHDAPAVRGAPEAEEAPTVRGEGAGTPVADQYIVVFRPGTRGVREQSERMAREHGARLLYVYEHALEGFAARMSPRQAENMGRNPNVTFIEQDTVVTVADTQTNATWGLDRIDQRDRPLNGTYVYNRTGSGVRVYVIDTGIRYSHQQFSGRAFSGYDAFGGNGSDCNGHGTHVAGTVGGTVHGVAKQVRLHAVRVLNCQGSGTTSGVIAGVDWVRANHVKPAVANMSLGGGASTALDNAVTNAINAGVTFAVAAGNDNRNACNFSPARVAAALTVGSTTASDARSSFSNYGSCVNIFAPGSSITSAWHTSDTATNTISGTSMAAPHVAGVAALYLEAVPTATPAQVGSVITSSATADRLSSIRNGSPNLLLYSLLDADEPPPPPPPPSGNVVANPGFEQGRVAWTESSSGGYALITQTRPRTGSWSAWLGGYNNATDYIHQRVTVPAGGTLTYWWRMETQETSTTTAYDVLQVRLYDGNTGAFLTTLRQWSNRDVRNTWSQDSISLAGYADRSVHVMFYGRTDSSLPTSFFIDDVALQ